MDDHDEIRGGLSVSSSAYEQTIQERVERLIAERGYDSIIYELVSTVYQLAQTSREHPENHASNREFVAWAKAVRSVIVEWDGDRAFENSITKPDRWFAQQLGISLD
jgi:hypothetical protein